MKDRSWHSLLKESPEALEAKYNNSSKKLSFLSFCLHGGYLSDKEYLSWAKETFQIPIVKSKFFEEKTPSMNLFKKWKDLHHWSTECLPLAEWDGHLFVGALFPDDDLKKKGPVQFLLCHPTDLEDWWKIYHPNSLEKVHEESKQEVRKAQFFLDQLKRSNPKLAMDMSQFAFSEMKSDFQKTMILTLSDNFHFARPFTWDEGFKEHAHQLQAIPLRTPSIFNIVTSTQKPFHGYVTPSAINDEFFNAWNGGITPEHATISPIIVNDNVVALLMGIGEKWLAKKHILEKVESITKKISQQFALVRERKAA